MTETDHIMDSPLFSRRSVPYLREEDDDSCAEIVLFDEDEDDDFIVEEYGDYSYHDDDYHPVKTKNAGHRMVTVVHSRKDPATGDFLKERKTLDECIKSGLEEAQTGVYAGLWYFTYLMGEMEGKKAWLDAANSRRVRELGGKALEIAGDVFAMVQAERERGNRSFQRGQINSALASYLKAEKLVGVPGIYLVPKQRDELVKIFSNQAECYLRMKKHEEARAAANAALSLDKKHEKSILRRAKAIYLGAQRRKKMKLEVQTEAIDDLKYLIQGNGMGAQEAQVLMNLIQISLKHGMGVQQ